MEAPEIAATIVMAAGLTYLTIEDIRHKKVTLIVIILMGLALTAISIWQKNGPVFILTGLLPGACAIIFSLISKGGLGLGDAALLLATGPYLGLWNALAVLMIGLLISSVTGILLLALKKAGFKTALPFVPFYLGGFVLWEAGKWLF